MSLFRKLRSLRHDEDARPSIGTLLRHAGTTLPSRIAAPLHRNDRGVVSIFFLLMFFTFFNAAALVWNTGQTMGPKLKAQAAADVAAYNSSVIMSRAINLTAQTNYAAVRNASAYACAWASISVYGGCWFSWTKWAKQQADNAFAATGGIPIVSQAAATAAFIAAWIYIMAVEFPVWLDFLVTTAPHLGDAFNCWGRVEDLADFQKGLIDAIPAMIEAQRKITEQSFGTGISIRLSQPISSGDSGVAVSQSTGGNTGLIAAPLTEGNLIGSLLWFNARFFGVDTGWPRGKLARIVAGEGPMWWRLGGGIGINLISLVQGSKLHVLTTQWGPFETSANTDEERKPFSVIATATESNESKRQMLLNYWFRYGINNARATTAYAEAETYLGLDSSISTALQSFGWPLDNPLPWRAWTPPGANWAGRLTRADHFGDAFSEDSTMRNMYKDTQLLQGDVNGRIPKIIKH